MPSIISRIFHTQERLACLPPSRHHRLALKYLSTKCYIHVLRILQALGVTTTTTRLKCLARVYSKCAYMSYIYHNTMPVKELFPYTEFCFEYQGPFICTWKSE